MKKMKLDLKKTRSNRKMAELIDKYNLSYKLKAISLNLLFVFMFLGADAQAIDSSIKQLYAQQIRPVVNVVIAIGAFIAAVYCGFLFFQGKREALKQLAMVIVGALVIKFLEMLVCNIAGISTT